MDPIMKTQIASILMNTDPKSVQRFSFEGIETLARVVNIYDPDTFTIIFPYMNIITKLNIRVAGIDAPEKRSKVDAEKSLCYAGIDYLNALILDKIVYIKFGELDKYGRPLAIVYVLTENDICEEDNIANKLILGGYARPYDGGTKEAWNL